MQWLKQSTAVSKIIGPILDSSGVEYASAVIGDISLSKNGATLTALASAATLTYIANGMYTLALTTGNTDTLGSAEISCNKSTYQMPPREFMVLPSTVYDALTTNATNTTGGLPAATGAISALAGAISTLTAAQAATGVWQDTTAGDFTVALSVGKSVMNGVSLGTGLTVNDITTKTGYSLVNGSIVTATFGTCDFTATMKTSIGIAVAASAVASVTGNVGGNVVGSVASVVAGVTVATNNDKTGYTASTVSDKTGYALTSGERTSIANEVEAQIIDETDSEKVLTAITDKIAAVNPSLGGLTLAAIASSVWANAARTLTAGTNIVLAKGVGITGFNDLSAAQVNAEADTALADYDGPTNAEMEARTLAAASYATVANQTTIINYIDTEVAAIKAKTDNLPNTPASTSDIPTAAANRAEMDSNSVSLAVIKASTDHLATAMELDGSVYRFTVNSLELAPTGAGGGGGSTAAEIWTYGGHRTLTDGAITEATFATPAEVVGRPTGILAMIRRLFERTGNKRKRTRSSGLTQLYGADNTTLLESNTQSTTDGVDQITESN